MSRQMLREMLQIIAEFNRTMIDKPWLWAVPCAVELITEVADLGRTLLAQLPAHASATAKLPAQTHASVPASAHASTEMSSFWGTWLAYKVPPPRKRQARPHPGSLKSGSGVPAHASAHASATAKLQAQLFKSQEVQQFWWAPCLKVCHVVHDHQFSLEPGEVKKCIELRKFSLYEANFLGSRRARNMRFS